MKNILVLTAILFAVPAFANPFEYFAGSYSVVGPVTVTNWNFTSCTLWNLPSAKAISVSPDSTRGGTYQLAVDSGTGLQSSESLGDFSCGGECYYKTSSRDAPAKEASSVYIPNGRNSTSTRGIIMNQTASGFELFIADVTYDLSSEDHGRNGYCFYEMTLQRN